MSKEVHYKDPNMYHEGVLAYREAMNLTPSAGFRRDIAVTIKTYDDLLIWQNLLAHWGYFKDGKWKARNPLDIKGMLTCFEFKKREKEREIPKQETLSERSQQGIPRWRDSSLPKLQRSSNGWKG